MVCSNFSDKGTGFFTFLARSLDAIEQESSVAYTAMTRALGMRTLEIEADGHTMGLGLQAGRVVLGDRPEVCDVFVRVDRAAILRLIDGERSIVDAALAGDLVLRGSAEDLAAFGDVLTAFVQGAVRSVAAPAFLRAYQEPTHSAGSLPRAIETSQRGDIHDE